MLETMVSERLDDPMEKVRVHAKLKIGEQLFLLLINYFWMKEVEGRLFYPNSDVNVSIRLNKKSSPIKVDLQEGKIGYSGVFEVLIFWGFSGKMPVFQGKVNISGNTTRQSKGGYFCYKTDFSCIEWLSDTRLNLGPLKIPLKRINNFLFSILRNRLADRIDNRINGLLSGNSIPPEISDELFFRVNASNPLEELLLTRLHIIMGNFESRYLPVVVEASLSTKGHSGRSLKILQKDIDLTEDAASIIKLNLDFLHHFAPPIVLETRFLKARLVFKQFLKDGDDVRIVIAADKGLKGEIELLLPVLEGGQFDPELLTIEKVRLQSKSKHLIFKLFQRSIRNKIRRDLKKKLEIVKSGIDDKPLFYSPSLSGFRIAVKSPGNISIEISGDDLFIKLGLHLSLVMDNQLPLALTENISE